MFENILSTLSNEEIIKKIEELKKIDKNSSNWKELLIVFVTDNFALNKENKEVKFIEGSYKIVFTKMDVTLDDLQMYISETEEDDEFYMSALKYIDTMQKTFNDLLIEKLEHRLSLDEMPPEEKQYNKEKRINNTINKVLIVLAVLAIIYTLIMLLGTFFISK